VPSKTTRPSAPPTSAPRPTRSAASRGYDSKDTTATTVNPNPTLAAIQSLLATFPTGEIAFGAPLRAMPSPLICVNGVGCVDPPLSPTTRSDLRDFAHNLRLESWGTDWVGLACPPTYFVGAKHLRITNLDWATYVRGLVEKAADFLGFRGSSNHRHIASRLNGLYLWEPHSLWRNWNIPSDDPSKVATLLIILNQDYTNGEVAIGYGAQDMLFLPAENESSDGYVIAVHEGASYDNLPVTSGYRIALTYDILVGAVSEKHLLIKAIGPAVQSIDATLHHALAPWITQVSTRKLDNFPLLYVLEGDYQDDQDLGLGCLTAEDRCKALAFQRFQRHGASTVEGYVLEAFLVTVTATCKIYDKAVVKRVRYAITRAYSLDGELRPDIKETIIDPRGALTPGDFADSAVNRQIGDTMSTSTRTRNCIMVFLEPAV